MCTFKNYNKVKLFWPLKCKANNNNNDQCVSNNRVNPEKVYIINFLDTVIFSAVTCFHESTRLNSWTNYSERVQFKGHQIVRLKIV